MTDPMSTSPSASTLARIDDRAAELAESYLNGNHTFVADALNDWPPSQRALLALETALCLIEHTDRVDHPISDYEVVERFATLLRRQLVSLL